MPGFTHLHTVPGFSLRYGASHPERLAECAAERGMDALALTDRDTVAGTVRFAKACARAGVRPLFGVDLAVGERVREEGPTERRRTPVRGASFLDDCLRCENARALSRQLPVQIEAHERLRHLQRDLDPRLWDHRHAEPFARLSNLLGQYTQAERSDARDRVTAAERALVDDLINGRLDLR